MDGVFYTFHDFMFHTESITYLLVIPALFAIALYWRFLAEKDDD